MKHSSPLLIALTLSFSMFAAPLATAATQATVKIEQLSPSTYGSWTLLSADGSSRTSKDPGTDSTGGLTIGLTEFGQTTLSVVTPPGMSAIISVYRGGELLKEVSSKQYSFPIYTNDNYRFVIRYALTNVGSLGVTSEPSNIRFRMKGPTGRNYTAKTPFTFQKLPAGKYSLYFPKTDKCFQPAVQNIDVESEKRNTAKVTLACNIEEEDTVDRSRISRRSLREYVEARERKIRGDRK